jgi:hypothetical protein
MRKWLPLVAVPGHVHVAGGRDHRERGRQIFGLGRSRRRQRAERRRAAVAGLVGVAAALILQTSQLTERPPVNGRSPAAI